MKAILIVDDDIFIRDIIRSSFQGGFRVFEASTYRETMTFPSRSLDLALIDYILPDRDGFEIITSLRDLNPGLPIIFMTGFGDDDIIIRALRKGVADYVKKPLDIAYLKRRVSELLGGPPQKRHHESPEPAFTCLDAVGKHIRENYMEDLSLDELAHMAGMSRFSFCRAFKGKYNQCFSAYLNRVRMQRAAELLANDNVSITEVAFSVGYRNSTHFNRVFRATYKMPPREYRRRRLSVEGNGE